MPKVSVIVPVYNTGEYIGKCIQSLVDQTLEDIEIILIDDGSTDNSVQIMREYESRFPEKIRIISKANGGQGMARNLGIRESTGEYIGFMDSDDWTAKEMYEEMYNQAIEGSYDMVECRFRYLDENGKELKTYGTIRQYANQDNMFFDPLVSPWIKLIRGDILRSHNMWFTEGCIYEDTAFFVKLIPYINKSILVDNNYVYHINRSSSTMNINKSRKVSQIFTVLEDAISFYQKMGFYDKYRDGLEYFCTKILLCSSMQRIAMISDKKMRNDYMNETFIFLNNHFPTYRRNCNLSHRPKNLYMKFVNRRLASVYITLFRLAKRI